MIDTHCHLDQYPDPLQIANECERLNIIAIGMTNLPSHFNLGIRHLLNHKKVRLALGMHPLRILEFEKEWPIFRENVHKTSYIGEIGLDFSKEGVDTKEIQVKAFKEILKILQGKNKILSLHSRKAETEVLKNLLAYEIKAAIFHWYSGPISHINEIVSAGYMFSINPAMIKSKSGQEIIRRIPQANILTESDGPFIEIKGRPVKPQDVIEVYQFLSHTWGVSLDTTSSIIKANFNSILQHVR